MNKIILRALLCILFFCYLASQINGTPSEQQRYISIRNKNTGKTRCVNVTNGSERERVNKAFCVKKKVPKRETSKVELKQGGNRDRYVACLKHCVNERQTYCQEYKSFKECWEKYGTQNQLEDQVCRKVRPGEKIKELIAYPIRKTWLLLEKSSGEKAYKKVTSCAQASSCRTCSKKEAVNLLGTSGRKSKKSPRRRPRKRSSTPAQTTSTKSSTSIETTTSTTRSIQTKATKPLLFNHRHKGQYTGTTTIRATTRDPSERRFIRCWYKDEQKCRDELIEVSDWYCSETSGHRIYYSSEKRCLKSRQSHKCWYKDGQDCRSAMIEGSDCNSYKDRIFYFTKDQCLIDVKKECYKVDDYGFCENVYTHGKKCVDGYSDKATCTKNRVRNKCYKYDQSKKFCTIFETFEKCSREPGRYAKEYDCIQSNGLSCIRYDRESHLCLRGGKPEDDWSCDKAKGFYSDIISCFNGNNINFSYP